MIKRALLFPNSHYLSGAWWHRLATVVFWAWLAALIVFSCQTLIFEPHSSCISVKYFNFSKPADLNCGSNAFDYALANMAKEPASSMLSTGLLLGLILYLAAILPSAAYRIALYIAKGNAWRDSPSAA